MGVSVVIVDLRLFLGFIVILEFFELHSAAVGAGVLELLAGHVCIWLVGALGRPSSLTSYRLRNLWIKIVLV